MKKLTYHARQTAIAVRGRNPESANAAKTNRCGRALPKRIWSFQGKALKILAVVLSDVSDGQLNLKSYGAGELVPALEVFKRRGVPVLFSAAGLDWILLGNRSRRA